MKSYAWSGVRQKAMLEAALDKKLCMERSKIKSYAWSAPAKKMLGAALE